MSNPSDFSLHFTNILWSLVIKILPPKKRSFLAKLNKNNYYALHNSETIVYYVYEIMGGWQKC